MLNSLEVQYNKLVEEEKILKKNKENLEENINILSQKLEKLEKEKQKNADNLVKLKSYYNFKTQPKNMDELVKQITDKQYELAVIVKNLESKEVVIIIIYHWFSNMIK